MTRNPPDLFDALAALDPVDADGLAADWGRSRTAAELWVDLTSLPADESLAVVRRGVHAAGLAPRWSLRPRQAWPSA